MGLFPEVGQGKGYDNPTINRLAEEQVRETDPQKRKEIIFEMQELLAEEVPEIPLYNTINYAAYRQDLYDGWMFMFDHHEVTHGKLSYLDT